VSKYENKTLKEEKEKRKCHKVLGSWLDKADQAKDA